MDGLSDSDLETLLKNFNELSAEEQHSLIAYLKKLEAREPQRVERLRQYVSAAASASTALAEPPPPLQKPVDNIQLVAIESDDDDYTVEEVGTFLCIHTYTSRPPFLSGKPGTIARHLLRSCHNIRFINMHHSFHARSSIASARAFL